MQRRKKSLQLERFEHRVSSEDGRNGRWFLSYFSASDFFPVSKVLIRKQLQSVPVAQLDKFGFR